MVTIVADVFSHDQFVPVSISEPFSFRVHYSLRTSLNLWVLHFCLNLHIFMYNRTPLIQKLVIQISSYPDRLGSSGEFDEISTKPICLEITSYWIKYSTFLWLLELQIRCGCKVWTQVCTVNSNCWNSYCHCSLFKKKNPIIQIFCISRWFSIPVNPDKWSSTVL